MKDDGIKKKVKYIYSGNGDEEKRKNSLSGHDDQKS
jgi:hypothetical protein